MIQIDTIELVMRLLGKQALDNVGDYTALDSVGDCTVTISGAQLIADSSALWASWGHFTKTPQ